MNVIVLFFWQFFIQDTKSSNGTYVNNEQVGRATEDSDGVEIKSGDVLQFGVDVTENSKKGLAIILWLIKVCKPYEKWPLK